MQELQTRILGKIEMIEVFRRIDTGVLASRLTIVVDKDVAHNCQHPAFEIAVINKFFLVIEGFESRVLDQVLSFLLIKRQLKSEGKKIVLHSKNRSGERRN